MAADAKSLEEEGVIIPPIYIIKEGKEQWKKIKSVLLNARYPTRALNENCADLNAALASIESGKGSLVELCSTYGYEMVTGYMEKLKEYAYYCMKKALKNMEGLHYSASEKLDDGSPIALHLSIYEQKVSIDFSGSCGEHPGNLNANPSIVKSCVMYVLRLLIDEDLPMNEGFLKGVTLHIPQGILNPDFNKEAAQCPAVSGGNIETSQRLVDTLLKALALAGCSYGTMNNLLFGNASFTYYETLCGGTGAGNGFDGADAVHQHMTNTKITDPEVIEVRYPVRLDRFIIRRGSGGKGRWKGGNGVIRLYTFLEPVELTVLTEHRNEYPYGLKGGDNGKRGSQYVIKRNGSTIPLKSHDTINLGKGDKIIMKTPGGGGYMNNYCKQDNNVCIRINYNYY